MLDAGDEHRVYWECGGNPEGKPALFLHGGLVAIARLVGNGFRSTSIAPCCSTSADAGAASRSPAHRRLTSTGTTARLDLDIELLRAALGVDRWTILGLSWGTTLGLAYAQAHPQRVAAMVLGFVTTTSRAEVLDHRGRRARSFPRNGTASPRRTRARTAPAAGRCLRHHAR